MLKSKTFLSLFFILLLAAVLRLWQLGSIPVSPDWDEAALGYNAYSIMHTGRDEYGKFLPLILRSFDDYKPGLYAYLSIPSIAIFGLNTFAVRLPSAILGILSVLAVYYLVKELFPEKQKLNIPLVAALLLAISPWHIQFSRVAFEANAAMAFNLFAIVFFLKGLRKPWFLSLSAFFFSANLYMYQSEKLFVPLIITAMLIIYRKTILSFLRRQAKYPQGESSSKRESEVNPNSLKIRNLRLEIIIAIFIFLIVCLPLVIYIVGDKGILSRATGVSITTQNTPMMKESTKRFIHDVQTHDLLGEILDSRRATQLKEIIGGYLSHFDFNWLFITGDQPRHHAPGMGLLYLWELPFLLIGLYQLFFLREDKQSKALIFAWFLLAPVPAAFTFDVPHAVRTLNFLPTFQIITALGLVFAFTNLKKYKKLFLTFVLCTLLFALFNIAYYLNQYFVQLNYFTSEDWQYGYQQTVASASSIQNNYKQIIVSDAVPMDQSYIFFLFYQKYPPKLYQNQKDRSNAGPGIHGFSKYEFRGINWSEEQKTHDILYIGRPQDFPASVTPIKTINYLDGTPAIEMVEG